MRKNHTTRKFLAQPLSARLPDALAPLLEQEQWCIWRFGKNATKLPFQPRHPDRPASVIDASHFTTYARAASVSDRVGFLIKGSGIAALDLDDCRDPDTEVIDRWALDLIKRARTYVEVTPSGNGLRIIGWADGPHVHTHLKMGRGKLEIYRDADRYITVTGEEIGHCDRMRNIDALIDDLAPAATRRDAGPHVHIDHVADDWRAICKRLKMPINDIVARVAVGKRSDVSWKISQTMRAKGASPGEVAAVLRHAKCWRDKHGDNERALAREVERAFRK